MYSEPGCQFKNRVGNVYDSLLSLDEYFPMNQDTINDTSSKIIRATSEDWKFVRMIINGQK